MARIDAKDDLIEPSIAISCSQVHANSNAAAGTSSCSTGKTDDGLDDATIRLLQLVCTEIQIDGGASFVTSIKEYLQSTLSSKRFNALLVHVIGKAKLLSFLERYSCSNADDDRLIFFAVDRQSTPHFVRLLPAAQPYILLPPMNETNQPVDNSAISTSFPSSKQRHALVEKVAYVLRKRQSKLRRRREKMGEDDPDGPRAAVNSIWLLQKCTWEVHAYLRCQDWYRSAYNVTPDKVQPVGTSGWKNVVHAAFDTFLATISSSPDSNEEIKGSPPVMIANGKVWLDESPPVPCIDNSSQTPDATFPPPSPPQGEESWEYLQHLDTMLTQLVRNDGATQVSLALLLHRHPALQHILGGRDLWRLQRQQQQSNRKFFQDLNITQQGNDIILQQSKTRNKSTPQDDNSPKQSDKRMQVDEVGHYSIANTKWGRAMANSMVHACKKIGWENGFSGKGREESTRTAIDLTASVGGMTLGLAKTGFFQKVIAVEIDSGRAKLCRQNMERHHVLSIVEVRNEDSMKVIPNLPSRSCLVIDPPWGGVNYKRGGGHANSKSFQMGSWVLEDVLQAIAENLSPCLVGLRLPVTIVVDPFLEQLRRDRNLVFEMVSVRKLSVQIFVVLHISTPTGEINTVKPVVAKTRIKKGGNIESARIEEC